MLTTPDWKIDAIKHQQVSRRVPEMCKGCARCEGSMCAIIIDPEHFWREYGKCFAKVSRERAREIEREIKNYAPNPLKWLKRVEGPRREAV